MDAFQHFKLWHLQYFAIRQLIPYGSDLSGSRIFYCHCLDLSGLLEGGL